ncbi:MAG TPA: futalosine hydrolase [Chitinophagaceae bacterium]|nr:futalosine hydrolase [Chitinophagaceae bacterium]
MDLLIVAATKLEIAPFLATNYKADVLITGVGIPTTIFNLNKKLALAKYDLVIQAGIAGTFKETFEKSDIVIIEEDTFADMGVNEKGNFRTIFEMGFADENEFPYKSGWLKNEQEILKKTNLPRVKAITVNKITDDKKQLKQLKDKFNADVESMEGAAFHYVCLQQKVNFLQLRSISNVVGERDKTKWKMEEAISFLNIELQKLIENFR